MYYIDERDGRFMVKDWGGAVVYTTRSRSEARFVQLWMERDAARGDADWSTV